MGMGNYANSAYIVDEKFVREMAGKELDILVKILEYNDCSLNDFMVWQGTENIEAISIRNEGTIQLIQKLWANLKNAFLTATGLGLYIVYHKRDDRGDDIDGAVWCVDGVMDYTPAGKKYQDKITYSTWTVFG